MFLLDWYHEWIHIRAEYRRSLLELNKDSKEVEIVDKQCQSCETLRQQLDIANYEKKVLLEKLLFKPEPVPERTVAPEPVNRPVGVPWAVRRQMLEREDREKARSLKNAATPDPIAEEAKKKEEAETREFEKELEDARTRREAEK